MDDLDFGQTIRGFAREQKLFGRFTLKATLGRGGMGIVWRAYDEELSRDVALKFPPDIILHDAGVLDGLKRETLRSLELAHHNIVKIYDFIRDEQCACISMEYVDGDTLSAMRVEKPNKVFEIEELAPLIEQTCEALEYAHTRPKIVHRDLKPANIMVNKREEVKVTDFGIAKSLVDSVSVLSMRVSGTLVYMSPHQLDGERPSHLDDIYSLGATIYELVTSRPPFHSGNIDRQIREKVPPSMAARREELEVKSDVTIPPEWEDVVAACLAKNKEDRPQSAKQVMEQLKSGRPTIVTVPEFPITPITATAPIPTIPITPPIPQVPSVQPTPPVPPVPPVLPAVEKEKPAPWKPPSVGIMIAAAGAILLVAIGLFFVLRPHPRPGNVVVPTPAQTPYVAPTAAAPVRSPSTPEPVVQQTPAPVAHSPSAAPATPPAVATETVERASPPVAAAVSAGEMKGKVSIFLQNWRNAWAGKDMSTYSRAYDDNFMGRTFTVGKGWKTFNRAGWLEDKTGKAARAKRISVEIRNLAIEPKNTEEFELTFDQVYTSDQYTDRGQKRMLLRADSGGGFVILREDFTPQGSGESFGASTSTVSPPTTSNTNEVYRSFVERWRQAWESKDIETYGAFYAPEFVGRNTSGSTSNDMNRAQWMADKAAKFRRNSSISVQIQGLTVQDDNVATGAKLVSFRQIYRTPGYSDTGRKTLRIGSDASGNLKILVEVFEPN